MRDAEKLMSRCIYLNVLKATISAAQENETSSETLEKYVYITLAVFYEPFEAPHKYMYFLLLKNSS